SPAPNAGNGCASKGARYANHRIARTTREAPASTRPALRTRNRRRHNQPSSPRPIRPAPAPSSTVSTMALLRPTIPNGPPPAYTDHAMRVFVYEHLSASQSDGPLHAEGQAMLSAVLHDLARCSHTTVEAARADDEPTFRASARAADFTLVIAPEFDDLLFQRC